MENASPSVRYVGNILCLLRVVISACGSSVCRENQCVKCRRRCRYSPTATLLEHALLAQGFMGVSKVAFPRRLQLQNRDSTGANFSNAIKCRCRAKRLSGNDA